jgi:hypothetical protein
MHWAALVFRKKLRNLKKIVPTYVAWCVPVPVQVLVPQKFRACGARRVFKTKHLF